MNKVNEFFQNIVSAVGTDEEDNVFYIIYKYRNSKDDYLEFGEGLNYLCEYKNGEVINRLNIEDASNLIEEIEFSLKILKEIEKYAECRLKLIKG